MERDGQSRKKSGLTENLFRVKIGIEVELIRVVNRQQVLRKCHTCCENVTNQVWVLLHRKSGKLKKVTLDKQKKSTLDNEKPVLDNEKKNHKKQFLLSLDIDVDRLANICDNLQT